MSKLKWIVYALLLAVVSAVLHYSLPGRDIVRITGQEVKREDETFVNDAGLEFTRTRDVNRIFAVFPDGTEVTYRNEDTDWGWPPYFKFDTANVSARAANLQSTAEEPKWVIVTHYGWRLQMQSWFKNIVAIRETDMPDQRLIPWFNIVVISVLAIGFLLIRRYVIVLYGRHVDPLVDAIDQQWDDATDTVQSKYRGVSGFFRRLFGR
ncbi:MAG: DUF1523 family protein [Pikeienuella sp.]